MNDRIREIVAVLARCDRAWRAGELEPLSDAERLALTEELHLLNCPIDGRAA